MWDLSTCVEASPAMALDISSYMEVACLKKKITLTASRTIVRIRVFATLIPTTSLVIFVVRFLFSFFIRHEAPCKLLPFSLLNFLDSVF